MSGMWYFEKKDLRRTPSWVAGMDSTVEARYRKEGAQFLIDLGRKMNLSPTTVATGVVYFHRFYMKHTFQDFPRYPLCCACLFLAGKVEETPKKCRDIIKYARIVLSDNKFAQFRPDVKNPVDEVMTLESILLKTIKFGIEVVHPHTFVLKYAKSFKGEPKRIQKMVQMAWVFANDSLCTTLCLQWEPEVVAIALIHLAGKLSRFEIVDWIGRTREHRNWWDMFVEDISVPLLEDICHQVLDVYSDSPKPASCESLPIVVPGPSAIPSYSQTLTMSPLPSPSELIPAAGSSKNSTPASSVSTTVADGASGGSEIKHRSSMAKAIPRSGPLSALPDPPKSCIRKVYNREVVSIPRQFCYPPSPFLNSENYQTPPPPKH